MHSRYGGAGPFTIVILLSYFLGVGLKGAHIGRALRESLQFRVRKYCYRCHKYQWFVKGGGPITGLITLFLILGTGGKWLLFLFFYPKKCICCGLSAKKASFLSPADHLGIKV